MLHRKGIKLKIESPKQIFLTVHETDFKSKGENVYEKV